MAVGTTFSQNHFWTCLGPNDVVVSAVCSERLGDGPVGSRATWEVGVHWSWINESYWLTFWEDWFSVKSWFLRLWRGNVVSVVDTWPAYVLMVEKGWVHVFPLGGEEVYYLDCYKDE